MLFLFIGWLYNRVELIFAFFLQKFRVIDFQWDYNEVPE